MLSIDYLGENMVGSILGATKLHAQLRKPLIAYGVETTSNTGQNNGFARRAKRGRLEVMAEILYCCNQQKTKTDIMYRANLNYAQMKKHLKTLTAQGLLAANKNMYTTTPKGHRFLELFVQLNDMLEY